FFIRDTPHAPAAAASGGRGLLQTRMSRLRNRNHLGTDRQRIEGRQQIKIGIVHYRSSRQTGRLLQDMSALAASSARSWA
ncbi:hypothetical protein NL393_28095, partial [Klebsiella pneumoniae]|nr:hypothetical protein [Klebsiella pneumoniae]